MKKICHMTSAHDIEDVRIFQKECVSLADAGYTVYLVERGSSYDKRGVHIIGVGTIPTGRIGRMTKGAKSIYETARDLNCDLYHIHDPELLPYALKLKKAGKKVVFDSHEYTREQILIKKYLPRPVRRLTAKVYSFYEDYVLKTIDGVIFPCTLNGMFPLPGKKKAIVNNVPLMDELYNKYDPNEVKEPNTVCLIGSLTYSRGVLHLAKAAMQAGCKVYLGGSFSPASLKDDVNALSGNGQIVCLGYLDRSQVLSLLKKACVGSAATLSMGQYATAGNLSTKAYEYMAMGVPVILEKNEFNEEMISRYQFGVCVDPENVEEYASTIRFLLDNPAIAKKMGYNGREAIRQVFNWEREFDNLLKLYQSIL